MNRELTKKQVLVIGWSVSLSAGVLVAAASAIAAVTHSGWIALAAFAIGMAVTVATAIALVPAWRRTMPKK
jgi:hypothetical protein